MFVLSLHRLVVSTHHLFHHFLHFPNRILAEEILVRLPCGLVQSLGKHEPRKEAAQRENGGNNVRHDRVDFLQESGNEGNRYNT